MENANLPPTNNHHVLPAALPAQAVQELHELQRILAFVDSRLESIEQFLNNFANQPNETNMNYLYFDDESVDTPLISTFPHSDNDSGDSKPMWESAKTVAPTPNSAIVQIDVDDNFVINSTHLKMICENKFDGYLRADPHDHIREFLAICNMFRYGETQSEAVKLLIFPFSLCGEAKTWFNELKEESITSWE
ncbi:hypothetical protein Tco_0454230 [Tanacetum coccineum]